LWVGLEQFQEGLKAPHSRAVRVRKVVENKLKRIRKKQGFTPAHQIKWVNIAYQGDKLKYSEDAGLGPKFKFYDVLISWETSLLDSVAGDANNITQRENK